MQSKVTKWLRGLLSSETESQITLFFWALAVIWTLLNLLQIGIEWFLEQSLSPQFYSSALLDFFVWVIGIVGISISAEGITNQLEAQKEYQKKIKESEEKYRLLVDMSPDAVAVHSKGKILYVNDAAVRLMRANTADELIGTPVIDFIHPASRNIVIERIKQMISSGTPQPVQEEVFVRRDQSFISVETIAAPLSFNGEPAIMTISRDISERKRIEVAIDRIEQGLSAKIGVEFFDSMVRHLAEALGSDYTFIGECQNNPARIETIAVYTSAKNGSSNFSYQLEGTPSAKLIENGMLCQSEGITASFPKDVLLNQMNANGYIGVPLIKLDGQIIGVLVSIYHTPIPDLRYAQSIMGIFAARASAEMERQSAIRHIEHQAHVMSSLYETSLLVNTQTDQKTLLNEILTRCIELLNAHMGGIYVLCENGQEIELIAGYNLSPEIIGVRLKLGEGLSGKIVQSGNILMIPDYMNWEERAKVFDDQIFRRVIGVPIRAGDRTIGSITVTDALKVGDFTEDEIRTMNLFADQAAIAIEKARLYDQLQREGLKYRNLFEHANDAILVIDPSTRAIVQVNRMAADQLGYFPEEFPSLRLEQIIDAEGLDETLRRLRELERDGSLIYETIFLRRSGLSFPAEISAHMAEYDKHPVFQFFIRDITERKHNEEEIKKQVERISALREIDMVIASSLDLQINLSVILDQAKRHLDMDAAMILSYDISTMTFLPLAHKGFRGTPSRNMSLNLAKSYAGRAALERQTIHIPDLQHSKGFHTSPEFDMEEFISYYASPLIVKGEVKGVMELFWRSPHEGDLESLRFMETLAGQAAIAIDNATLFDTLQQTNFNLTLAYDQTLEGWAESLETQEIETKGHSKRTAELAMRLAMEMSLSPEQTANIRRGALLHDIGKLVIPEAIRNKKEKLTNEEWDIVKQHPKIAFEILSKIEYLKNALAVPHYHHENWDGSGYPHGLKEKEIPIAARIFSIVDVWDALTNPQTYREAWTKTKALNYIKSQRGIRFDPQVVDAFLRIVHPTGEIKQFSQ